MRAVPALMPTPMSTEVDTARVGAARRRVRYYTNMKFCLGLLSVLVAASALAQDATPELTAAEKQFQDALANVTLAGYFTRGDSGDLRPDRYVIEKVTKIKDDLWKFDVRIQYNKKDTKVSMPLPVKWAGDTPVISLTDFSVPGLGSFTARVVIYDGSYAGTWGGKGHGGGKLFGKIVKNDAPK